MEAKIYTKKEQILKLFKSRRWVSQQELIKIAYRYGARIYDLRQEGYVIDVKPCIDQRTKKCIPGKFMYRYIGKCHKSKKINL